MYSKKSNYILLYILNFKSVYGFINAYLIYIKKKTKRIYILKKKLQF